MELKSSTSHDVCELWNGSQIVRVMGSSPIQQILHFLPKKSDATESENGNTNDDVDKSCGLYTLEKAVNAGLLKQITGNFNYSFHPWSFTCVCL